MILTVHILYCISENSILLFVLLSDVEIFNKPQFSSRSNIVSGADAVFLCLAPASSDLTLIVATVVSILKIQNTNTEKGFRKLFGNYKLNFQLGQI